MQQYHETADRHLQSGPSKKLKQEKIYEGKYAMLRIVQEKDSCLGVLGRHYQILWARDEDEKTIENACTWVPALQVDPSAVAQWEWWKANKKSFQPLERLPIAEVETAAQWIRHTITCNLATLFQTIVDGRWYTHTHTYIYIYIYNIRACTVARIFALVDDTRRTVASLACSAVQAQRRARCRRWRPRGCGSASAIRCCCAFVPRWRGP